MRNYIDFNLPKYDYIARAIKPVGKDILVGKEYYMYYDLKSKGLNVFWNVRDRIYRGLTFKIYSSLLVDGGRWLFYRK